MITNNLSLYTAKRLGQLTGSLLLVADFLTGLSFLHMYRAPLIKDVNYNDRTDEESKRLHHRYNDDWDDWEPTLDTHRGFNFEFNLKKNSLPPFAFIGFYAGAVLGFTIGGVIGVVLDILIATVDLFMWVVQELITLNVKSNAAPAPSRGRFFNAAPAWEGIKEEIEQMVPVI